MRTVAGLAANSSEPKRPGGHDLDQQHGGHDLGDADEAAGAGPVQVRAEVAPDPGVGERGDGH